MMTQQKSLLWKENLEPALEHHIQWWNQKGMVFWLTAPKNEPWEEVAPPEKPQSIEARWYDPIYRARRAEYHLSRTYFGADALPMAGLYSAAGDLATFLGVRVEPADGTVWMHPIIDDPETFGPLQLDLQNPWLLKNLATMQEAKRVSRGRYYLTMPDFVENIDILATLRGTENLMMDMIERPQWVEQNVARINELFFEAFNLFYQHIRDEENGNTFVFNLWGPGRTAKVQCDSCSMFGPEMFRQFVTPALTQQCRWLDFAMYHLDGDQCLVNLDEILSIEPLRAVEWTPVLCWLGEGGGIPKWYDIYRRILSAGKSVQAICVKPEEVIPLLDACGPNGMFICCNAESEDEARKLEEKVAAYR